MLFLVFMSLYLFSYIISHFSGYLLNVFEQTFFIIKNNRRKVLSKIKTYLKKVGGWVVGVIPRWAGGATTGWQASLFTQPQPSPGLFDVVEHHRSSYIRSLRYYYHTQTRALNTVLRLYFVQKVRLGSIEFKFFRCFRPEYWRCGKSHYSNV